MPKARIELQPDEVKSLVRSGQKKYVRYKEGAVLYSMGLHTFQEVAKRKWTWRFGLLFFPIALSIVNISHSKCLEKCIKVVFG